jgi:hypothetical protein
VPVVITIMIAAAALGAFLFQLPPALLCLPAIHAMLAFRLTKACFRFANALVTISVTGWRGRCGDDHGQTQGRRGQTLFPRSSKHKTSAFCIVELPANRQSSFSGNLSQ